MSKKPKRSSSSHQQHIDELFVKIPRNDFAAASTSTSTSSTATVNETVTVAEAVELAVAYDPKDIGNGVDLGKNGK